LVGCNDEDDMMPSMMMGGVVFGFIREDTGNLNYAYALEQLEACFPMELVVAGRIILQTPMQKNRRSWVTCGKSIERAIREFF